MHVSYMSTSFEAEDYYCMENARSLHSRSGYEEHEQDENGLKRHAYERPAVEILFGVDPQMEALQCYERLMPPFPINELQRVRKDRSGRA